MLLHMAYSWLIPKHSARKSLLCKYRLHGTSTASAAYSTQQLNGSERRCMRDYAGINTGNCVAAVWHSCQELEVSALLTFASRLLSVELVDNLSMYRLKLGCFVAQK